MATPETLQPSDQPLNDVVNSNHARKEAPKKPCQWCNKPISVKNMTTHYKRCSVVKNIVDSGNNDMSQNMLLKVIQNQNESINILKKQVETMRSEIKFKDYKLAVNEEIITKLGNLVEGHNPTLHSAYGLQIS